MSVPRVHTLTDVEIVDDVWIRYFAEGWGELPDEFYLRELQGYDGDSSLKEIAELLRSHGMLCLDDFAEWDGGVMGNWEQRMIAREYRMEYAKKYEDDIPIPEVLLHESEGRPHLDFLRFLRDGWIVASATGEISDYFRVFDGLESYERESEPHLTAGWVDGLNKGLHLAHARVKHPLAHEQGATLYGASCLQLYNHIVEGAQYKICANETCGQIFVRQQGRSETRQRKSEGVKYCSSKCARAQAQRELRRRRATQNSGIFGAPAEQSHTVAVAAQVKAGEGNVPSLGELLREKRIERQLSDRDVRRRTGVVAPVLVAIEADDYGRYEGQYVHMERWLTALARLYALDERDVVARYRSAKGLIETAGAR